MSEKEKAEFAVGSAEWLRSKVDALLYEWGPMREGQLADHLLPIWQREVDPMGKGMGRVLCDVLKGEGNFLHNPLVARVLESGGWAEHPQVTAMLTVKPPLASLTRSVVLSRPILEALRFDDQVLCNLMRQTVMDAMNGRREGGGG